MSRSGDEFSGVVREHSGWLIPLGVFIVTAGLSALVLAYYFAPDPARLARELPSPTDSPLRVALTVGPVKLRIPANYLPMASARRGGVRSQADLLAVLPNLEGYSLGISDEIDANAPDSTILFMTLKTGPRPLAEQDRLQRIYLPLVENGAGTEGPFGLREYGFRSESGYRNQVLFFGTAESGPVTLLCDKADAATPSPNCLRDIPLGNGLTLDYRFKRSRLEQWRAIDKSVRTLVASFEEKT